MASRTDLVHAVLDAETTQLAARVGLLLPDRSPDQALRYCSPPTTPT